MALNPLLSIMSVSTTITAVFLMISSMIVLLASPAVRLQRLGVFLRVNGIDGLRKKGRFRIGDDHFLLDYVMFRWLRPPRYTLGYAGILGAYFYGWYLLGLTTPVYAILLIGFVLLVLRKAAARFLAPYTLADVASVIESSYPPMTLGASLSSSAVLVTYLYLLALTYFIPNLFQGTNFLVFLAFVGIYTAFIIIVRIGKKTQPIQPSTINTTTPRNDQRSERVGRSRPLTGGQKIFVLSVFLVGLFGGLLLVWFLVH